MRQLWSDKEYGSLTVEATLFLIPFMCAFLTLVNFARFVQAEMLIHHAITQTAKEISTYSYVLTKTNITSRMQNSHRKSKDFLNKTDEVVTSMGEFFGAMDNLGAGDDILLEISDVVDKAKTADESMTSYFSNPKEILSGALAVVKNNGEQMILKFVVGGISRNCIKESLSKISNDPDEFLKNIGIVDGMSGLDFSESKWNPNEGGKADIEIVVTFKLKNILFPDFDFGQHEFCQSASTLIW